MIYLRGANRPSRLSLLRNYGLNLTLILGLIAAITLSLYALRVAEIANSAEPDNRGTSRADRTSQRRSCSTNFDADIQSGQPIDQVNQ
jgi:hypothetical protein